MAVQIDLKLTMPGRISPDNPPTRNPQNRFVHVQLTAPKCIGTESFQNLAADISGFYQSRVQSGFADLSSPESTVFIADLNLELLPEYSEGFIAMAKGVIELQKWMLNISKIE